MLRAAPIGSQSENQMNGSFVPRGYEVNAFDADQFVTGEPTPKPESRRGWRRRRIRRGKS